MLEINIPDAIYQYVLSAYFEIVFYGKESIILLCVMLFRVNQLLFEVCMLFRFNFELIFFCFVELNHTKSYENNDIGFTFGWYPMAIRIREDWVSGSFDTKNLLMLTV